MRATHTWADDPNVQCPHDVTFQLVSGSSAGVPYPIDKRLRHVRAIGETWVADVKVPAPPPNRIAITHATATCSRCDCRQIHVTGKVANKVGGG